MVEVCCRTSLVLGARIGDAPLSSATDGALCSVAGAADWRRNGKVEAIAVLGNVGETI